MAYCVMKTAMLSGVPYHYWPPLSGMPHTHTHTHTLAYKHWPCKTLVRKFNWYFEALPLISCIHKVLKLVIVTLNLSAYIHSWILMSGDAIKSHYPIKSYPSLTPLEKPKDLSIKPQALSAFQRLQEPQNKSSPNDRSNTNHWWELCDMQFQDSYFTLEMCPRPFFQNF